MTHTLRQTQEPPVQRGRYRWDPDPPRPSDAPRTLIGAARAGGDAAADEICDQHLPALFALAYMILRDRGRAEIAIIESITDACRPAPGHVHDGDLRRDLARRTYAWCMSWLASTQRPDSSPVPDPRTLPPGSALAAMAGLEIIGAQQRAAAALVLYGKHTYGEAADVLKVPARTLAGQLSSVMRDYRAAGEPTPERAARPPNLS